MDNVFEMIAANYTAVGYFHQADFTPTTQELLEKLVRHTGNINITLEEVFLFMDDTGFVQWDIGEMHFVWLMRSDHPFLNEREM